MIKIYIDKDGNTLLRFSPKKWAKWINEFIEEGAYLLGTKKLTPQKELEFIREQIKEMKAGKLIKIIAIDEEKKEIVGVCDIKRKPRDAQKHNISFGLAVKKEYRKKGIGEKLLRIGIKTGKKRFKPKNIWIEVAEENLPARKLYEKLGFIEVARLEKYLKYNNRYIDMLIMKLQKSKG